MELGMIGLGKMGGFMTERLLKGGHRVVAYDRTAAVVQALVGKGAVSADSL
jgi:6-phosphogluconate dehydrogenase